MEHMLRPLTAEPVRCDIVHASMNGLSMLVAMAAKWRYGTPVVMSEHGIYLRERYLAYLDEKTTPRAVRVLVLSFFRSLAGAGYLITDALAPHSSYNRRWQLQNGADPDRMWTMYNGVAAGRVPARRVRARPAHGRVHGSDQPAQGPAHADPRVLVCPGRRARRAAAHFRRRRRRRTSSTSAAAGGSSTICDCAGAVVMEGRVESPVDAYHAASRGGAHQRVRGLPVTVIEAMACGLPIVCTNVGGVSEAVADAGIVVPPRDHVAVAHALITLLRDNELRRRMAQAARSRVLRMFELGDSLQAYRRVYDALTDPPAVFRTDVAARPPRLSAQPAPPSLPRRVPRTRPAGLALGCRPRAVGRVRVGAGGHR